MVEPLAKQVKELYLSGEYDEIFIVYTNLVSTLKQSVYARQLLPVTFSGVDEVIRGITPEKGKFSESKDSDIREPIKEHNSSHRLEKS